MEETSANIIEELATQGVEDALPVAEGAFSFDLGLAQAKQRRHGLADPEFFVLLLVEAAHRIGGCACVDFSIDAHATRAELRGVELSTAELATLLDVAVSASVTGLGARAAALEVLRRAVSSFETLGFERGKITSTGAEQVLLLREGQAPRQVHGASAGERAGTTIELREHPRLWLPWSGREQRLARRRALLVQRCRQASIPILLDGRRLDSPRMLSEVESYEVVRHEGREVAWIGHSLARADATLLLVGHGILLESLVEPELGGHRVARVDVSDLPRDLSHTKIVRTPACEQRLASVREALGQLGECADPQPEYVDVIERRPAEFVGGAALSLMVVGPLLVPVLGWFAFATARRRARLGELQRNGVRGCAEILEIERSTGGRVRRLELHVYAPGFAPYVAELEVEDRLSDPEDLHVGMQIFIVADPADITTVYFAAEPQRALPMPRPLSPA